jgi:hypothetical protein
MTNHDWSAEETDDPLYADRGSFYKVRSRDGSGSRNCCLPEKPSPRRSVSLSASLRGVLRGL